MTTRSYRPHDLQFSIHAGAWSALDQCTSTSPILQRSEIHLFLLAVRLAAQTDDHVVKCAAVLAVTIDKALMSAAAIKEIPIEELEARRDAQLQKIKAAGASKELAKYSRINTRHLITALADSFLTYVSHLIQATIRKNKSTLKSNEMISH